MGRYELETPRRRCHGILYRLKGVPARTWYKVDEGELQTRLLDTSKPDNQQTVAQTSRPVC